MSEHETIADIIAEKRRDAAYLRQTISTVTNQKRRDAMLDEARYTEDEADRLEAALKREVAVSKTETTTGDAKMLEALKKIDKIVWGKKRHTKEETEAHRIATEVFAAVHSTSPEPIGGDCAKLREALDESRRIASDLGGCRLNDYWKLNEIVRVCEDALAAPPRNCDKYANHNDAMKAFDAFVREQGKLGFINPYTEAFKWLFTTATEQEGGNDGNE